MPFDVTIRESLFIKAPLEDVWSFTRSELHRPLWSDFCPEPEVVVQEKPRSLRFDGCGGLKGVWTFEPVGKGVLWTQTHTLSFDKALLKLIKPYLIWKLRKDTRHAMKKVKEALEFSEDLSDSIHEDFY